MKDPANENDFIIKKPLRSIHVLQITRFIKGIGGMENRLVEFLKQPVPGFVFYVFSLEPIPDFWRQKLTELKIPFGQSETKYSTPELVRFALQSRIDLAHLHHIWPQAVFELKKAGVPIVIEHDHYAIWGAPSQIHKYLEYRELVDGVITVSEAGRQLFLKRLNYDPTKITTIHNGVDFKSLSATLPVTRPKSMKVVTAISRLDPEKGIKSLIKAIPFVIQKQKNVQFWIVGNGCQSRSLRELASKLKLKNYVRFWGERQDIGNFLVSTDLFVLPSFREPFSGALIEASYWAKPAIAANIDGNMEIISHRKTGILINPSIPVKSEYYSLAYRVVGGKAKQIQKPMTIDPTDLGKAILSLLKHPERRRLMGQKARERAIKLFSIEHYSNKIIAYYHRLLKEKGIIPD